MGIAYAEAAVQISRGLHGAERETAMVPAIVAARFWRRAASWVRADAGVCARVAVLACSLMAAPRLMAQVVPPADVACVQCNAVPGPASSVTGSAQGGASNRLKDDGFPSEALPARTRRVSATGVIVPAATASTALARTLPASAPGPAPAQAQAPIQAPAPVPIAAAPVPANATPETTAMPIVAARHVTRAIAAAPPGKLNDDGSALTPPDLSGYLEQSAKLAQIQRDQLALQQLQVWQTAIELAPSRKKPLAQTARTRASPAAPVRPYLVDLTGVGDDLQAHVMVPGYGETIVRAGQTLPNHWQIESIDDDGVSYRAGPGRPIQRIVYQTQAQIVSDNKRESR